MYTELNKLFEAAPLSEVEAKTALTKITEGAYNESQVAAFLATYLIRPITVEELSGFKNALLDVCEKVDLKNTNRWTYAEQVVMEKTLLTFQR